MFAAAYLQFALSLYSSQTKFRFQTALPKFRVQNRSTTDYPQSSNTTTQTQSPQKRTASLEFRAHDTPVNSITDAPSIASLIASTTRIGCLQLENTQTHRHTDTQKGKEIAAHVSASVHRG